MKRDVDFVKEIYGASFDDILKEYAELLQDYSEYALKEILKNVKESLKDSIPLPYLEWFLNSICRVAEKKADKERCGILSRVVDKAKLNSEKLLRDPLDALRNVFYAKHLFNQKLAEARIRNEEAQSKHKELLVQYIQEKVEQKFTTRRRENAQILTSEIMEHSKKMNERNKSYMQGLKNTHNTIEKPKRTSSLTSDSSSNSENNTSFRNELQMITERMFESSLIGLDA